MVAEQSLALEKHLRELDIELRASRLQCSEYAASATTAQRELLELRQKFAHAEQERQLAFANSTQLKGQIRELLRDLTQERHRISEEQKLVACLRKQLEGSEATRKKLQATVNASAAQASKVSSLSSERRSLKKQCAGLQSELQLTRKQRDEARLQVKNSTAQALELTKQIRKKRNVHSSCATNERVLALERDLRTAKRAEVRLRAETSKLLSQKETHLFELRAQLKDLRESKSSREQAFHEQERSLLEKDRERDAVLASLRRKLSAARKEGTNKKKQIATLEAELKEAKSQVLMLQKQEEVMTSAFDDHKAATERLLTQSKLKNSILEEQATALTIEREEMRELLKASVLTDNSRALPSRAPSNSSANTSESAATMRLYPPPPPVALTKVAPKVVANEAELRYQASLRDEVCQIGRILDEIEVPDFNEARAALKHPQSSLKVLKARAVRKYVRELENSVREHYITALRVDRATSPTAPARRGTNAVTGRRPSKLVPPRHSCIGVSPEDRALTPFRASQFPFMHWQVSQSQHSDDSSTSTSSSPSRQKENSAHHGDGGSGFSGGLERQTTRTIIANRSRGIGPPPPAPPIPEFTVD